MGILSWLTRKFSRGKRTFGTPCFKVNDKVPKEESIDSCCNEKVLSLEDNFTGICDEDTVGEIREIRARTFSHINSLELGERRSRASTMPAEMPSYYTNFYHEMMIKTEVEMHPFRKNRRGGICPDNVQDYYRSWDSRNNSM